MYKQLKTMNDQRLQYIVGNQDMDRSFLNTKEISALERKIESFKQRKIEIVKAKTNGQIMGRKDVNGQKIIDYLVHHQYVMKKDDHFYIEEDVEERQAAFSGQSVLTDEKIERVNNEEVNEHQRLNDLDLNDERAAYQYSRREAVQYAENWWNSYNPNYKKFEVDCTNYISQCLKAGGAPMTGFKNRSKGWWYSGDNWSYSWAVAHAFRWYLSGAKNQGLQAREVSSAYDLKLGDVICYDFEGDGKWNHTTIVTAKDGNGEPLVNAHTTNSRHRYWKYEDSTAWTPHIKYKFFHIIDGN